MFESVPFLFLKTPTRLLRRIAFLLVVGGVVVPGIAWGHSPYTLADIENWAREIVEPAPPPGVGVPSAIETLFVVEMSHLDIGFTAPPSEVARVHADILEEVISLCDADPDFRWTIEALWQLEQFDLRASPQSRARLASLIAQGRIEVSGGFASMHSGSMAPWEVVRWGGVVSEVHRRLNVTPRSVLGDDVPGWSWALPRVMSDMGIDIFLAGSNDFIGRGAEIPRSDYPFLWSGPDGSEVLTWISDDSYAEGYIPYGLMSMDLAWRQLTKRLPEWEESGYPFNSILVMRGFDNAMPNLQFVELAREWNATYDNPVLLPATPSMFAEYIARQDIPLARHRGDWSGRWDVGGIVTPSTQKKTRHVQRLAPAAEAISVMGEWLADLPGTARDRGTWGELIDELLTFDEHSGGGGSWPGMLTQSEARQHNREVAEGARRALALASGEFHEAIDGLTDAVTGGDSLQVVVVNSREWARGGIVAVNLPEGWSPYAVSFFDEETGARLETQPLPQPDRIAVEIPDVPPLGYRRLAVVRVAPGARESPPAVEPAQDGHPVVLQNERFAVVITHADAAIISLIDLETERDWVSRETEHHFNRLIRASNRMHLGGVTRPVGAGAAYELWLVRGPLVESVRLIRVGSPHRFTEVTLRKGSPVIEVTNTVLTEQLPFVPYDKSFDFLAFPFPFDLPGFEARVSSPAGPMRVFGGQPDQLPGAEMQRWSVGPWVDISTESEGMTVLVPDALVAEFETIAFSRTRDPTTATVVSRFHKNVDESLYAGDVIGETHAEPGEPPRLRLRYGFAPRSRGWDANAVERLAAGFADPLQVATVLPSGKPASQRSPTGSAMGIEGGLLMDLKPAEDGRGVIVRIQEVAGVADTITLVPREGVVNAAWTTDLLERDEAPLPIRNGEVHVPVSPRGIATVRLDLFGPTVGD